MQAISLICGIWHALVPHIRQAETIFVLRDYRGQSGESYFASWRPPFTPAYLQPHYDLSNERESAVTHTGSRSNTTSHLITTRQLTRLAPRKLSSFESRSITEKVTGLNQHHRGFTNE